MTLDPQKLKAACDYIKSLDAQVAGRMEEVARKLGIDPDRDLLIVPMKMMAGSRIVPKWMTVTEMVKTPYVVEGVRDREANHG